MKTLLAAGYIALFCLGMSAQVRADDIDDTLRALSRAVSGNRARDYVMRLWQYDKWSTLPMWNKTAAEAKKIMEERSFDEAVIVDTPADGETVFGTWTNPIGWDCRHATLEVIEPANIPDEYRFLCNYIDNPTSLNNYSCPTPPEGIETELVLLEHSSADELEKLDADGKIILVGGGSRAMKRHLDAHGAVGIVSDEMSGENADFTTANQWLNGWSDLPGGWQMNASDSPNHFGFSISQKKGAYLRRLLRDGVTVKVRAVVDSRYYTDGSLPYVVGSIAGSDASSGDVLVVSHIYEWGANDDCSGAAIDLEALGVLRELIDSGKLPRPKRTIRMWLGFECYGSMAYTMHNLDRLKDETLAVLCCDSPADDYDLATTMMRISSNFNACPSFTDALMPEVFGRYYSTYAEDRMWRQEGFMSGLDNFFGDPMIGVPINAMYHASGYHLHHNSMDTIERVDPRSLKEQAILVAAYLYELASAGEDNVPFYAGLSCERGMKIVAEKASEAERSIIDAEDGAELGEKLDGGLGVVRYYAGLQRDAVLSIARCVPKEGGARILKMLESRGKCIMAFSELMCEQLESVARERAGILDAKIVRAKPETGEWEKEASSIIPRRTIVGTMTLEQVPVGEWEEVSGSPRWWSAANWASASYFWCDGERNLLEIKNLVELEAGRPVTGFDLVNYYRFLERHGMVEFVR